MSDSVNTNQVSEDEEMLQKLASYIDRIRNTFINASELAKAVQGLREQVDSLGTQVQTMQQQLAWADETLGKVRQERDEANVRSRNLAADLENSRSAHDATMDELTFLQGEHASLRGQHDSVRRERDDAHFRIMELEEENQRLKAQLAQIKSALGVKEPEPQAQWPSAVAG